jgi:hypothetical protein
MHKIKSFFTWRNLMQCTFLDCCKEFTGTALEAPLDGLSMAVGRALGERIASIICDKFIFLCPVFNPQSVVNISPLKKVRVTV